MKKNDIVKIKIEDITSDGNGVGRHQGMAVFVPMTAIGDVINTRIVKVNKSYSFGIIESMVKLSPDRIEVDCPVFKQCGGCDFRHISYEAEKELKRNRVEQVIKRIGGIELTSPPTLTADDSDHYRNKAIYPIKKVDDRVIMGFYSKRSHRIVEHYDCLLHPEFFADIAKLVREFLEEKEIAIYDEETHTGLVRSLFIRYGAKTGEVMVSFVINGTKLPYSDELVAKLVALNPNVVSVVLNINTEKGNTLLGKECRTIFGKDSIDDILCGLKFSISPLSFYQVNRDGAEILYNKAKEFADIQDGENIIDLYCGAGTIGLSFKTPTSKLIGVEIIPDAVENANQNAIRNNIDNTRFICADAAEAAKMLKAEDVSTDLIIVDPPRKGCEAELIKTIKEFDPKRVVMISCDPATAARDVALFNEEGYRATKLQVVDMFSRTKHVECIVLMTKIAN